MTRYHMVCYHSATGKYVGNKSEKCVDESTAIARALRYFRPKYPNGDNLHIKVISRSSR